MNIYDETDLLDEGFRKKVIEEIEGNENIQRKASMKKRHEVYKDNTKEYVLAMMEDEAEDKRVAQEIIHRVANISFCKKIIDKKSMVYRDGAQRRVSTGDEDAQDQIDDIVDNVNLNSVMKKVNRYVELFRNALVSVLPYKCPQTGLYSYYPTVMAPYLYDVIEDQDDPEKPRAIITSYYNPMNQGSSYAPENQSGMREIDGKTVASFRRGDGKDQTIADSPSDKNIEQKEYIWWSSKFHFTTNCKGQIIPGKQSDDLMNPIGMMPFYSFSKDQDGNFWAVGGEDIVDGAILLNILLSDLFYIAKYQGMGIGYMFGKGVPKNAKVGASSFITMEVEEGDPTPQIGFATSNPPIQAHLDMIEAYIAFLLSTNKLEAGTIQASLNATNAASGIHEMIKRAENMDDIQDQREMYRDGEPVIFEIMKKWHNLYFDNEMLKPDIMEMGRIKDDLDVGLKFPDPQPFVTEKEKLEIIEMRLHTLGIDSMLDAIKKDNPDLTDDEAENKLKKVMEEKLIESNNRMKMFQGGQNGMDSEGQEEEREEEESEEVENGEK